MSLDDSRVARRFLRRNMTALFVHGLLGQTGFRVLQAPTFLPTYISLLTGNDAAVGLARALQSLGMFVSPVLGAGVVGRRRRVRRLTLVFGSLMRSMILVVALLALLAPESWARALIWPALLFWGLGSGLQMVAFNVLFAKAIPLQSRGRMQGLRNVGSGLSVLVVSALAGVLLERYGYPKGYGAAFLAAFLLTALGLFAIAFVLEPRTREVVPAVSTRKRFLEIPELFRAEPHYGGYVQILGLAALARGCLPYYPIVFAGAAGGGGLGGRDLALLTILFTLAQAGGSMLWGELGDRGGYRRVFLLAMAAWGFGSALVLADRSLWVAYLVFPLVGAGFSGLLLAQQNIVLEIGRERERALRIATTNSFTEGVGMAGFVGAAAIAQLGSPVAVFAVSLAVQVAAVARARALQDPRSPFGGQTGT